MVNVPFEEARVLQSEMESASDSSDEESDHEENASDTSGFLCEKAYLLPIIIAS